MTATLDDILRDADAANAPPPAPPPEPDHLGDALVAHKLVPNDFILDLNHGLTIPRDMERPPPWNLPSRMFIFPIEVTGDPRVEGHPRRMGLVHPLLVDHPFVQQVQKTLGIELDPDGAPNRFGYTKRNQAMWWHAVDLVSRGLWRELLETERFTTPDHIAGAVSYGLRYSAHEGKKRNGHISPADARKVMTHLGSPEPEDKRGLLLHFMRPSAVQCEKGKESWPINHYPGDAMAQTWGYIIGIEAGWFAHDRAGFLGWTPAGRDKFTAVVGPEPVEPPEPNVAETPEPPPPPKQQLADAVPRPAPKLKQMDLF